MKIETIEVLSIAGDGKKMIINKFVYDENPKYYTTWAQHQKDREKADEKIEAKKAEVKKTLEPGEAMPEKLDEPEKPKESEEPKVVEEPQVADEPPEAKFDEPKEPEPEKFKKSVVSSSYKKRGRPAKKK